MLDLVKIKQMTEDGFSARKIAEILKYNFLETQSAIKDNNFNSLREDFFETQIPRIIALYKAGVSAKQLGKKFSIDKRRIQKWAKEEGILRDKNESHRIHFFNEHIFDTIDTEEKAYWLGFLYADVYNGAEYGSVSLGLKLTDIGHIKKFCEFIGYDINLIRARIDKEGHKSARLTINSIYLCDRLTKLGCMQGKSLILKRPDWLYKDLIRHFIRGYFDGDGSITCRKNGEWKCSFAGTKDICEWIQFFYKNNYNIEIPYYYISKTNNDSYEAESNGNIKVFYILDILYKNSTIFLQRKYDLFLKLKERNIIIHPKLFNSIFVGFSDNLKIGENTITNKYIDIISIEERKQLVLPILEQFTKLGFIYPNDPSVVKTEYQKICNYKPDLQNDTLDNMIRTGTYVCKFFCHSFFHARTRDDKSIFEAFNDLMLLEQAIRVKLGLTEKNKSANCSMQTIISEIKESRLAAQISIFKPTIAKYMYMKYSAEGDVVGDYSCGFGGRLLGAMACGRKYIGTDPLTIPELENMVKFFDFKNCVLINSGSESYRGRENSVDLYWSSPPYFDQEIYSDSLNQAYSKGENYFYNIYWRNTLENIRFMLKPEKWFGVNVSLKHYKMVEIAKEYFGDIKETINLRSVRSHFVNKKEKYEHIYMFRNNKGN
jgi:hypothetical protein